MELKFTLVLGMVGGGKVGVEGGHEI